MTDPYKSNPGGPQYGPPGTGPEPNQYQQPYPQQDPYAQQQQDPYAQQQNPYAQQQNPYGQQPYPQQQPYAAGYPPQGYPAPIPPISAGPEMGTDVSFTVSRPSSSPFGPPQLKSASK